jgi:hypothetical protein
MQPGTARDSWLRSYIGICAGVLFVIIAALVLLVVFGDLGLSGHGIAALFLGALAAVVLTMVLMGLVFMSSRSGGDTSAHEAGTKARPGDSRRG